MPDREVVSRAAESGERLYGLSELYAKESNGIAVDSFAIVKKYPFLAVSPMDLSGRYDGRLRGLLYIDVDRKNKFTIVPNSNDSIESFRFTIAHEIAHIAVEHERLIEFAESKNGRTYFAAHFSDDDINLTEMRANALAGGYLMPRVLLEKVYSNYVVKSLDLLSYDFRVTCNVMRARVKHLGWPFIDDSSSDGPFYKALDNYRRGLEV
jgi:hypothetical protein